MVYQTLLQNNLNSFNVNSLPATLTEIQAVESSLGISIPLSLKEFLLVSGGNYDELFGGGGVNCVSHLFAMKNEFDELLTECGINLSRPYFVFWNWSGDMYMFVYLDEGDDPTLYKFESELYSRGDNYIPGSSAWGYPPGVLKIADSFSSAINELVNDYLNEM